MDLGINFSMFLYPIFQKNLYLRILKQDHVLFINSLWFFENIDDVERWTEFLFNTKSDKLVEKYNQRSLDSSWWYIDWGVKIE